MKKDSFISVCRSPLFLSACCLVLTVISACSSSRYRIKATAPDTEVVEAEGTAPIINGDITGAKKTSLHDAMKSALGLVIGVYVSQESLVSKAMLIEDNITSQTEGYIEKYDVLDEHRDGDFYKTRIRALVRKEDLSAKLKTLDLEPKKLGNPLVKFSVNETIDGSTSTTKYAEGGLKNAFIEQGFSVSDSESSDIIVEGSAETNFNTAAGLGGLFSYRASCSLTAKKSDSKDIAANVAETAGGVDVTKDAASRASLVNAAKRAGQNLSQQVLKYLRERSTVQLTISGVKNINKLNDFTMSLRAMLEIRDCWVRSYSGDTAVVDLELKKGTASDVARHLEQDTNFSLKINKVGAYSIDAGMTN